MRTALKFVVGIIFGAFLWTAGAASYNRPLAAVTAPLLRLDARFGDAALRPREQDIAVVSRSKRFPPVTIPADQLTYNVILLFGLFAANAHPMRDRNLRGFALALLLIVLLHPLALLATIESTYAARLGDWGRAHYGTLATNIWLSAELFYRVVAMFAVVFAVWWLTRQRESATATPRRKR